MNSNDPKPLLAARDLKKHYLMDDGLGRKSRRAIRAVDGISLDVVPGETLGIVGESGCGKSTLGRTLIRLLEPTGGSIRFDDRDLLAAKPKELKKLRRDMQIIFQDPAGSLNPRMRVRDIVAEGLDIHSLASDEERQYEVNRMLERVGLPGRVADRFPRQFSGGQRQRIGIARALVMKPKLVVADEPVSALDVSIQSQVLNLLVELKRELQLTYVFVAHDVAVVGYISDRIAVMYLGKIVEIGAAQEVLSKPQHPYTVALLSAIPSLTPDSRRRRIVLSGDVPTPVDPPSGCRFRTRCPIAQDICAEVEPPLEMKPGGHVTACHFTGTPISPHV